MPSGVNYPDLRGPSFRTVDLSAEIKKIGSQYILWTGKRKRCLEQRGENGCIEWVGFRDKWGYGRIGNSRVGSMFAHRKAWEKHRGPIPDGMLVCHHCDNPACITPEHLFLGTHRDNILDSVSKGRHHVAGEDNPHSKVGVRMVKRMRALKGKSTHKELMVMSGLKKSQVYNIISGKQWANLKEKTKCQVA